MAPRKQSKKKKSEREIEPVPPKNQGTREGGIDVGSHAQIQAAGDVVGRDKIINWITNVNVPWWTIVMGIGLVVLLLAGVILYPQFRGPEKMTGAFNVVVADFGEQRVEGQPLSSSEDSRLMSNQVFDDLVHKINSDEYLKADDYSKASRVQLQHKNIGFIQGAGVAERARSAGELAAKINASVIIYGTLDMSAKPYLLLPEFYVAPGFQGAEELVNEDAFGKPIPFESSSSGAANWMSTIENFQPRVNAWSFFTLGLAYLQIKKPDKAVTYFQQAENQKDAWAAGGKEVVYLFEGAAFAKQGSEENLRSAEGLYQKALDQTHDQYARAFLGLGNLSLQRVQTRNKAKGIIDFTLVDKAIVQYKRALTAEIKPTTAYVAVKAYSNLGVAFGYKAILPGACPNEDAVKTLREPISAYEKNPRVDLLQSLGAQGYYQLGWQYQSCGDQRKREGKTNDATLLYNNAATQYQASIAVATPKTVRELGWFGLPIGAPPPRVDEADWQQLRWTASQQLAYTFFTRAEMGNSALYDQALPLYKDTTNEYEKQKARGGDAISDALAAEAYCNMGLILETRNDKDAAILAYKHVLDIAPEKSSSRDTAQERLRALGQN